MTPSRHDSDQDHFWRWLLAGLVVLLLMTVPLLVLVSS